MNNKKPFLLPDQAWSTMENGYIYRERELKREGNKLLGRLERDLTGQSLGMTSAGVLTYTFNTIFSILSLAASAELDPGTLVITITTADIATFTDNGDGTFTVTGAGKAMGSYVNYATGEVVINLTAAAGGGTISAGFSYFPGFPVMGIWDRDISTVNESQTIFWDTTYAYIFSAGAFSEYLPGSTTTWKSSDADFFWAYNYQGPINTRLLFVTNFVNTTDNPMRFTDGGSWTTFAPLSTMNDTIWQAKIIIPYYSRLILLNTWEGPTAGGNAGASNFFTRCRFSAEGDPTAADAFRTDIFGLGGFLDAPTAEQIIGATFVKNTLVVDFEYSTWQLRFVGVYGLPFVWERVSSDYGSGSTFSGVLFDNYRLNIGDVGITRGNSIEVERIDLDIPDEVFQMQNEDTNKGAQRITGVRDFQRELIFWNYVDSQDQSVPGVSLTFPDKVLLYNYRNNSWAIFRDNVTFFGTYELESAVTWSSTTVLWNNEDVTWNDPINQAGFPAIVKGNQEGFVHLFGYQTQDDPSLSVTGIATVSGAIQLKINNHNLLSGEIIYLQGMMFIDSTSFLPVTTSLNNVIYQVSVIDANTILLGLWDTSTQTYFTNFPYSPVLANSIYVGGGEVTLFPKLNITTKDINLFQAKGMQTKTSRIDFLLEPQPNNAAVTVNIYINATPTASSNLLLTTPKMSIQNNANFNPNGSDYQWFSFFQTLSAQYFRIQLTYDDDLMNTLTTHQSNFTLYAINAWTRPGGRFANP